MIGALTCSGDVMLSQACATRAAAEYLAARLAEAFGPDVSALAVPMPGDVAQVGWVALVLGPATVAALSTPVPHTIRPVAWAPGVLP